MSPFHDRQTGHQAYTQGRNFLVELRDESYYAAKAVLAESDAADAATNLEIAPTCAKFFFSVNYLLAAARARLNTRLARQSADYAGLVRRYNELCVPEESTQSLGSMALTQSAEADLLEPLLPSDTDRLESPSEPPRDENPTL